MICEPEECVAARVTSTGAAYLVTLVRADGQSVPILCRDAQGAADLLDEMNPANTDYCILPRARARVALFAALGIEDLGIRPRPEVLH
jgi:hypothetical protein